MKWDLTKGEFEAIYSTIKNLLYGQWGSGINDQLYKLLLTKLYAKFYAKNVMEQSRYKIKIEQELALVFLALTVNNQLPYDSYEGNAINRINALIHKQCFTTNINNNNTKLLQQ